MHDPIVEEVRKARDAHAAKFNYDLGEIYKDIKRMEKASGVKLVSLEPKRIAPRSQKQAIVARRSK